MKRYAIIVLAVLGLVLLTGGVALAATYGPHGNYTADTAACGQCHNTHAAAGKNLIQYLAAGTENDIYRTCTYCHKNGGQSKYDVVNGAIVATGATYASSGGGFSQEVVTEGATPAYTAISSKHNVEGNAGNGDPATLWAPGYSTATADYVALSCASCHNPHGQGTNSRAIRSPILGDTIAFSLAVTSELADEAIQYTGGVNDFCGACHKDYKQTAAGSGDIDSGTYSTYKRHRVGMDPSAYSGTNPSSWTAIALSQPSDTMPLQSGTPNTVVCLTCHKAHGTAKTNTVTFNRSDDSTSNSSTLLRLNNRGVCEACHNK